MNFQLFGKKQAPTLLLIPGLGVSYEIFLPLIRLVEKRFRVIAVEVDSLCPQAHVEIFKGMNHGQLLIDHPEEIAQRIIQIIQ